ncbi:MAG: hypothetical protein SCM11_11730 [Bacillota bacterium]|nr:hypothetical protein [Bacillota bacterium]
MSVERRHRLAIGLDQHSLITEIMQSLLILASVAIPVIYFAAEQVWLLFGVFLFALIAGVWIRCTCRHIWQFLLMSLIVIVLPLVLPILPAFAVNIWPRLIALPVLLFISGRAFYQRLKQSEEKPLADPVQQAMVIGYLLALNLIALRLGLTAVSQAYFYVGIIYLMLALYRWHRLALASQLERFLNMPTQPADRIMHFNRILLLGYGIVTLLLLLVSPLFRLHDLLPLIGTGLLAALRWLMRLLSSGDDPVPTDPVPEPTQPPSGQDPHLPFEPKETARWLEILQEIFYYLMIGVAILILLAILVAILYSLYKRFYESAQPASDKMESLLPSLTEQTKDRLRRMRNRLNIQFGQTPAQRIRRSFYRLIEAQIRRGLTLETSQTTRQIMAAFDYDRFPDLTRIQSVYEAARYGPDISTAEDADLMQEWYRKLRKQDLLLPGTAGKGRKKPDPATADRKGNA